MYRQPAEGDLLMRKYRLERCLGRGGMGRVWAARHMQLDRRVAIKVMHPELADQPELVARLLREGQAAARLRSPRIAQVLDVGFSELGVCLVMEYLEGKDLEQLLRQRGALPLREALEYLLQACEGVAEAHAAGIVHRDLKPANLFLAQDPYGQACIKILDFGISKFSGGESEHSNPAVTTASVALGTPLYMAPEQMRAAHSAGIGADIWALGAILYELVTGRTVWSGATISEICVRVATDPTPSVRALFPSLPNEVDQVVQTCLQKDPLLRYRGVLELVRALTKIEPELGAPAFARVARLLKASPALDACPSYDAQSRSAPSASTAIPLHRTNAAWGRKIESTRPRGTGDRPSILLKYAPALLLCLVGGAAGVWWTQPEAANAKTEPKRDSARSGPSGLSKISMDTPAVPAAALAREAEAAAPMATLIVDNPHPESTPAASSDAPSHVAAGSPPTATASNQSPTVALPRQSHSDRTADPSALARPTRIASALGTARNPEDVASNPEQPDAAAASPSGAATGESMPEWGGRK